MKKNVSGENTKNYITTKRKKMKMKSRLNFYYKIIGILTKYLNNNKMVIKYITEI